MNIETNFMSLQAHPNAWTDASLRLHAWRGECMHFFALAEFAVSETLAALSADPVRGANIVLPHLVGQKLAALASAIAPDGPFAAEGRRCVAPLDQFRELEPMRVIFSHGLDRIALEKNGKWIAIFQMAVLRGGEMHRSRTVVEEAEAKPMRDRLHKQTQSLCANLNNLRLKVGAAE